MVRHWPDALGVSWVIVAGVAALLPALFHGQSLGPYDYLSRFGLSQRPGVVVHNPEASDQITQMIPWTTLAWTEVHHGQLPLWNPYSALGTPLAFNWQSAPFGLPALVGYLFPLELAYTAGVLVTLIVAGTGAYVLGKTLRLHVVGCVLAGTVYELCGAFFGWLGWPVASVMSWAGWLLAAVMLVVRGEHRVRSVVFLALAVAASVYSGQPDSLIALFTMTAVFTVVFLARRAHIFGGPGSIVRPLMDLAIAGLAGVALAAPLLMPGIQLLSQSVRSTGGSALGAQRALSLSYFIAMFVGYDRVSAPTMQNTAIGSIVVVLALTGVRIRWRRHEVTALTVAVLVIGLLTFGEPVIKLMNALPGLHAIRWPRAAVGLGFLFAILAGIGMDELVHGKSTRSLRRSLSIGFTITTVALIVVVALKTGRAPAILPALRSAFTNGLEGRDALWVAFECLVGLAGSTILIAAHRRRKLTSDASAARLRIEPLVGLVLLAGASVSLVGFASPLWTSNPNAFVPTSADVALRQTAGSDLVGLGPSAQSCMGQPGLGLPPNSNILVDIHEMAVYDPMIPRTYFASWIRATGQSGGLPSISTFCPQVTSAPIARQFGIEFVLESHGSPGPKGAIFDRRIGDEDLYRIPGSSAATLTSLGARGALPPDDAEGTPVAVNHPSPSVWRLSTSASTEQVLRLHLTDVPGWHATIDGHPLALKQFSGLMIQALVPPGDHVVVVTYWPKTFTVGLMLAAISVVGLSASIVVTSLRRRLSHRPAGR